jgi:predicted RND superfamily exporter protein
MTFGLWGLIEGRVGLAVSVISAISLGIVVDDTVHLLSKYLRARRTGMGPEDSVRYAFRTVGRAIFSTSIILVAGFLVLTWSGFRVNSSMGLLTAIAITFALMADVLFLPPLLLAIDQDKKGEKR